VRDGDGVIEGVAVRVIVLVRDCVPVLVDVLDAVALAVADDFAEPDAVDVAVEDPVAVRVFVVVGRAVAAVKAVLVGTEDAEAESDGESDVLGLMRYARKCTP
jgi:hypothetical protein